MLREGAKQRLIGAVVIVALVVIFVPMLFEPSSLDVPPPAQDRIPAPPAFNQGLKGEVFLGPGDSGVGGIDDSQSLVSKPLALPPAGDLEPASAGAPGADTGSLSAEPNEEADADTVAIASPGPAAAPTKPPKSAKVETESKAPAQAAPAAGRAANGGMPSWVIQVASLNTPESAAELEGKLRAGGFPAFVEKAEVNGKLYYRVRVGPELDRSRAEQTAARLRERHKLDPFIKNYP